MSAAHQLEIADTDPQQAQATLVRVTFTNADSGFTVMQVDRDGGARETWVGIAPPLLPGQRLRASGRYEVTSWGPQFKAEGIVPTLPNSAAGIEVYLARGALPGIGPAIAKRIVAAFGVNTFAVLTERPRDLLRIQGLGAGTVEKIIPAWARERLTADVTAFLAQHGATTLLASRIVKRYADRALHVVSTQPYRLALEVAGVGFKTADAIAQSIGIAANSPERAEAAALHALGEMTQRGHCYAVETNLVRETAKLLGEGGASVYDAVRSLDEAARVIVETLPDEAGTRVVYPRHLHLAEVELAARLHELLEAEGAELPGAAEAIAAFEREAGVTLAPEQRAAVEAAATSRILVLTGGPGTGKCLGRGTPVLMYDGTVRPVEDVRDGDLVMGPDSLPRTVSGTTQGRGPLYEIRPIKGTPWVCNDAHILTVIRSGTDEVRDLPLKDYLALGPGAKWRVRGKLFKVPVDFQGQRVAVDPYIVGLWLGDGTRGVPSFTTAEPEVIEAVTTAATACGMVVRTWEQPGCSGIRITHGNKWKGAHNHFGTEFRGMVDADGAKGIPLNYKVNTRENRLQLLAGIVDTDGFTENKCIEIVTKWRGLADDIAFVARSLGICVVISPKPVQLDGWPEPRVYHRLILSGHLDQIPSRVPRRKVPPRLQIKDALRTGFDAVPIGDGDYFGFQLDGDGRFLLGDFTVTHNTACTKAILYVLEKAKVRVLLASPTGRAAKRLAEATGRPAATIHRMLGVQQGGRGGFAHHSGNRLATGALIVDESSMCDLALMNSVLQALPKNARLVLVGDKDQLPSVGPGAVLRDIIASGAVPTVTLTRIFRQAEGSQIIEAAARINSGRQPIADSIQSAEAGDEFFMETRTDPSEAAATIVDLVANVLPSRFGFDPARDVQVLTPMNKGATGTVELNRLLQEALNGHGYGVQRGPTTYRVGDPVMQLKNDYDREVYNGDRGFVVETNLDAAQLVVDFDGRRVTYGKDDLEHLMLAYASSIHRSQGSTIPCVVVVMLREHMMLLSRNLLYTGITRAARLCVLVNDPYALTLALRETRRELRCTRLAARLRSEA